MAKTNASRAAVRANYTRRIRSQFIQQYSERTLRILAFLRRQAEGRRIPATLTGFNPGSVAAVKANLTRGVYNQFVKIDSNGQWSDSLNLLSVR